jgi:hypothetical protein
MQVKINRSKGLRAIRGAENGYRFPANFLITGASAFFTLARQDAPMATVMLVRTDISVKVFLSRSAFNDQMK